MGVEQWSIEASAPSLALPLHGGGAVLYALSIRPLESETDMG